MLIHVTPNSKTFSLTLRNGVWNARIPVKPVGNAANTKLVQEIEKITKTRVRLVSGMKSRDKTITADNLSDAQLNTIFESHTGGM